MSQRGDEASRARGLKLRGRRLPTALPKLVIVLRDPTGRYWVTFAVDQASEAMPTAVHASVGVDMGITHLATLSTRERIENPRNLETHRQQLGRLQQRLARQCKGRTGTGAPVTAARPSCAEGLGGQAWGPSMPARRMSSLTWRAAVWRVMGHSARVRPRGLAWTAPTRCTSSSACTSSSGIGTTRQWLRRRLSVAIRSSAASRSTSLVRIPSASLPAAGERERAGQRLHGGFGVDADRGEEAIPLLAGEVLPPARADQHHVGGGGHGFGLRFIAPCSACRRPSAPFPAALVPTAGGG